MTMTRVNDTRHVTTSGDTLEHVAVRMRLKTS